MLTRLPAVAPEMQGLLGSKSYAKLPSQMFLDDCTPKWETLRVAHYVSRTIISTALQMQLSNLQIGTHLADHINLTMLLLESAVEISTEEPSEDWFLIKAFLWTSWQRAATLHHYQVLETTLRLGIGNDSTRAPLQVSQTFRDLVGNAEVDLASQMPQYMCKWAFRLLRNDVSYIGQDLRRFFERFSLSFGSHTARCMTPSTGSPTSCDGLYPSKCLRLGGLDIQDQSAHDYKNCDGHCFGLYWNKDSWTKVGGGAAVLIDSPGAELKYCEVSAQTMAVSHVWSHGQGGRPENDPSNGGTGLNSCLNKRFSLIARHHGCNSYWLDTACIPSNHQLRREAIANINRIFAVSKLTLVCDKDLMTIDISKPDTATMELILVTTLVCYWNVRAWTLLEALRARHNIHILCKDNHTIGLKEVVNEVLDRGCIDIAVSFLSAQHVLPFVNNRYNEEKFTGFVSMAVAADLLSHRHASRPGDEIVIWDLLMGDDISTRAEQFWRAKEGGQVRLGLLVSDLPRISGVNGLSWAPLRPNFPQQLWINHDTLLYSYGGDSTVAGLVTRGGLDANWFAHKFQVKAGITSFLAQKLNLASKTRSAVVQWLASTTIETPLQPHSGQSKSRHKWHALLLPQRPGGPYDVAGHPRRPQKDIFVVVGSHDGQVWTWLGLLQAKKGFPLEGFKEQKFLIE